MPPVGTVDRRSADAPWYVKTFDRVWLEAYAHRDDEEARRHAPFVVKCLGLRAGQRILDVGCGAGRYCRAFARLGLRATGVDLSEPMLAEARERSPDLPGTPTYLRWDARELPFSSQYDGAVSMFTSFGYFDDPEDDLRILRGVRRALVVGGRFLLDFLNEPRVRAEPEEVTERAVGHARIVEERRIDENGPGGPCVRKHVEVLHPVTGRVEATFDERVRLYTADELDALLVAAGLVPFGERMGDLEGAPHGPASPRFVRVAERRAG